MRRIGEATSEVGIQSSGTNKYLDTATDDPHRDTQFWVIKPIICLNLIVRVGHAIRGINYGCTHAVQQPHSLTTSIRISYITF
jgi:hypothetical protein